MSTKAEPKPYKGPESYQPEDSPLFFGRDQEADQLVAKILSSRFTLLHAQSGAGKTSLLNARIIPGLETRDRIPIRILPQNDPLESIRVTALQTLFPPLSLEAQVLEHAVAALAGPGEDPSISELLSRFDALDLRQPVRLQLVRRRSTSTDVRGALFPAHCEYQPIFSKVLRGSLDLSHFLEHVHAFEELGGGTTAGRSLDAASPASVLHDLLLRANQRAGVQEIVNQFYLPTPDLNTFFENIERSYGHRCSRFEIVLILDQFEELFTRFVDPGSIPLEMPNQPLDWRLRWELFDALRSLYIGKSEGVPLPIRYVVAIRDEYIAQLDPIRGFVPDLDSSAYHLTLLTRQAAQVAVREPALRFGYLYSEDCFRNIINQLTKEDRFIEPTHLQIVCEKLWFHRGQDLATTPAAASENLPRIEASELEDLNGAAGILRSFFRDFLNELTPEMRVEVLEMLDLLVTSSGTRNIVERNELTNPEYSRPGLREELLARLEQRTIVRLEGRLGGQFAEITHEFLIGPVLEALRNELSSNPDYSQFRYALRLLGMFEGVEFRGRQGRLLSADEFRVLNRFRSRIRWNASKTELMLRSAVAAAIVGPDLMFWREQYENLPFRRAAVVAESSGGERLLSLEEIQALGSLELPLPEHLEAKLLASLLDLSAPSQRDEVAQWIRRIVNHGAA